MVFSYKYFLNNAYCVVVLSGNIHKLLLRSHGRNLILRIEYQTQLYRIAPKLSWLIMKHISCDSDIYFFFILRVNALKMCIVRPYRHLQQVDVLRIAPKMFQYFSFNNREHLVTSLWAQWHIKSPASPMLTQTFIRRWIPRTNVQ